MLILCLLHLAATGALLYFGKTGVVLGISRNALRGSHFWVAFSTVILAAAHLVMNFRVYLTELRVPQSARLRAARRDKSGKDSQ